MDGVCKYHRSFNIDYVLRTGSRLALNLFKVLWRFPAIEHAIFPDDADIPQA